MSQDEKSYYLGRAESEIECAQRSDHPAAVRAHYTLAGLYLDRVYGPAEAAPDPCGQPQSAH